MNNKWRRKKRERVTNWAVVFVELGLVLDVSEHGQEEGESLSTSGLGDSDHISTRHDDGHGLGLDRSGLLETMSEK